jgi:hypothetical protein
VNLEAGVETRRGFSMRRAGSREFAGSAARVCTSIPAGFTPGDVQNAWDGINDFTDATNPISTADTMKGIGGNPHLKPG